MIVEKGKRVRFLENEEILLPKPKKAKLRPNSASSHPLGILPSGNFFLHPKSHNIRPSSLGNLHFLSDTLLISILSTLGPSSLLTLSCTSKALLAFTYHESLWKDLFVDKANGVMGRWDGSWRRTYLCTFGTWPGQHIQTIISISGLYSDVLFQPYLCAQSNLNRFFDPKHIKSRLNLLRHSHSSLDNQLFASLYARPSRPIIITGAMNDWKSFKNDLWTLESLIERFGDIPFRAEAFDMPIRVYKSYVDNCKNEDSPLYIFDCRFVEKTRGEMGEEFAPLKLFGDDLFRLLGPDRPNYRWLIAGPIRTGSTFHKDPNGTSAWNAVLTGRKGWVMFPPDTCPPGVYVNDDESEVTSPLSIAEWFLNYFDHGWETYGPSASDPFQRNKMVVGICEPGEIVYVPSGWWHLVVNLEDSVAVTQNFVSEAELANVLRFMKQKPDQMSGFKASNSPQAIYQNFCDELQKHYPTFFHKAESAIKDLITSKPKGSFWSRIKRTEATPKDDAPSGNSSFSFAFSTDVEDEEA